MPEWLKVKLPSGKEYQKIVSLIKTSKVHTVCNEAACMNRGECYSKGIATIMILGNSCTRQCKFCNVKSSGIGNEIKNEPKRVSEFVKKLGLKYVVITSVTRDDLADYGAKRFVDCVKDIKKDGNVKVEVLVPDFNCEKKLIEKVVNSCPDVFSHNVDMPRNLFSRLRPNSNYDISLNVLKIAGEINKSVIVKSGIMVGLGENWNDIVKTMKELKEVGVQILTIGQYLKPSKKNVEVEKYYTPDEFEKLKRIGMELGFKHVESGPLVRSSFHAGDYCG